MKSRSAMVKTGAREQAKLDNLAARQREKDLTSKPTKGK